MRRWVLGAALALPVPACAAGWQGVSQSSAASISAASTSAQALQSPLSLTQFGAARAFFFPSNLQDATGQSTDAWTPPEAFQLGGMVGQGAGALNGGVETNGGSSLMLRGAPYGTYDNGCLLCVVMTERITQASRAGIDGFVNYPADIAGYNGFNAVNLYNGILSIPPRLVVSSGVTFTASRINFATPLSAAQLAQLRRNEYLLTNVYDPSLVSITSGALSATAISGASALTLAGNVGASVGQLVAGYHLGLNGMGVLVTSVVYNSGSNTTSVGLSQPLVNEPDGTASWSVGTSYYFETRSHWNGSSASPATLTPAQHPQDIDYAAMIQSWDPAGNWIQVTPWTVLGGGNTSTGQVPVPVNVDPSMRFSGAAVLIGGPDSTSNENIVSTFNPNDSDAVDSQIFTTTGVEYDLNNNASKDYAADMRGITLAYHPNGAVTQGGSTHAPRLATSSYGELLFGDIPNMLEISGGPDTTTGLSITTPAQSVVFKAPSMWLHGNQGIASSSATGTTGELWEASAYMDGANNFRLGSWLSQDNNTQGAGGGGLHLGLLYDGTQGVVNTPQSQLVFAPSGAAGAVALLGYNGQGLTIGSSGAATLTQPLNANNILLGNGNTLAFAPSSGTGSGEPYEQAANASTLYLRSSSGSGATFQSSKLCFDTSYTYCLTTSGSTVNINTAASVSGPMKLATYAYASLPATGTTGNEVLCTDCLKPGESAGSGTGMLVFDDGHSHWVSTAGTVAAH